MNPWHLIGLTMLGILIVVLMASCSPVSANPVPIWEEEYFRAKPCAFYMNGKCVEIIEVGSCTNRKGSNKCYRPCRPGRRGTCI